MERPSGPTPDRPFARATAVEPESPGRYRARIAQGWDIAGNTNGGYLLSIAATAMADATGRRDPTSVTAHYLSPTGPAKASVDVEVIRAGRRFSTAAASLTADGARRMQVLGTFCDLDGRSQGPEMLLAEPPELPDPAACRPLEPGEGFPPPFAARVEMRLHPDDSGFLLGRRSGTPTIRGWVRLPGGEVVGTIALLTLLDSFPPTIFNVDLPIAWTPTVELTAHVRAAPARGWLAGEFRTRFVSGGFLEVDGELWDSTGRLVAQSRQLALVPRAPGER